jgi:hypothetical protein
MNIEGFNQLIDERDLNKWPPLMDHLSLAENDVDVSGIERLFEHLPLIGVHIFLDQGHLRFRLTAPQIEQGLILSKRIMLNFPNLAKRCFLSWGVFEKDKNFLEKLKEEGKKEGCIGTDLVYGSLKIVPFSIDIEDGFSLCLLAKGIVHRFDFPHEKEWPESVQELSNNILNFGLTADHLCALATDVRRDVITRAASQLLSFICVDTASLKDRLTVALQDIPLIQSLINDQTASWYVAGLCHLMKRELGEHVPGAVPTADALLAIARDRIEIRSALASMLAVWREASSSPVNATQSLDKWLDE